MHHLANWLLPSLLLASLGPALTSQTDLSVSERRGSPSGATAELPSRSWHGHIPRMRNLHGSSGNWAGYAIEANLSKAQNGSVTSVRGRWIVPAVEPRADFPEDTYS